MSTDGDIFHQSCYGLSMTNTNHGRGRNAAATREAILKAARHHFLHEGYDRAGLRGIAADAKIDPALICRYFGSKKQLFAEVLEGVSSNPMAIFSGDIDSCGARIAEAVLAPGSRNEHQLALIQLVTRSCTSTEASRLVHEHIEAQFIKPISQLLGGPQATQKTWLMASMLVGWIVLDQIKPANAVSQERLARMLQAIIAEDELSDSATLSES